MKKIMFLFSMLLWMLAVSGCSQDDKSPAVENLILHPSDGFCLEVGETRKIEVRVQPGNALLPTLTWSSSNSTVATVDNGVVTGVATGNAEITVIAGDVKGQVNIDVVPVGWKRISKNEWSWSDSGTSLSIIINDDGTYDNGAIFIEKGIEAGALRDQINANFENAATMPEVGLLKVSLNPIGIGSFAEGKKMDELWKMFNGRELQHIKRWVESSSFNYKSTIWRPESIVEMFFSFGANGVTTTITSTYKFDGFSSDTAIMVIEATSPDLLAKHINRAEFSITTLDQLTYNADKTIATINLIAIEKYPNPFAETIQDLLKLTLLDIDKYLK